MLWPPLQQTAYYLADLMHSIRVATACLPNSHTVPLRCPPEGQTRRRGHRQRNQPVLHFMKTW
jgi:hypothetical protein